MKLFVCSFVFAVMALAPMAAHADGNVQKCPFDTTGTQTDSSLASGALTTDNQAQYDALVKAKAAAQGAVR